MPDFEQILGIHFINASVTEAVNYISQKGGYIVVPAAPALANIQRDAEYRRALLQADLAIADSGFMVLLWRIFRRRKIRRISGLQYTQALLVNPALREQNRIFLVLPTEAARSKAMSWLATERFQISTEMTYVAPLYESAVHDERLVSLLNASRPHHIIICISGGTQEKLGLYLREHLGYRPAIHCTGAALGFLTGDQKSIPNWADRLYLGWLLRLFREPRRLAARFSRAFELPRMIWRNGENLPPLRQSRN